VSLSFVLIAEPRVAVVRQALLVAQVALVALVDQLAIQLATPVAGV
jgi:hypothetical protein